MLKDGICDERREGRFHRATSKLKRLVVLGHTGFISLEAVRWLHDVGATLLQIDADGRLLLVSTVETAASPPALKRSQALAPWTGVGTAIVRDLLRSKLSGQAAIVRNYDDGPAEAIETLIPSHGHQPDVDQLRLLEAQAAACYWQTLAPIPIHFARSDLGKVPEHWLQIGGRHSPLTNSARAAVSPAHAVLNYLYSMLEAETRLACLVTGLDPSLGVLHVDVNGRQSLLYDLMEAVRPDVDRWLLTLLASRVFTRREFFETREGQCRLLPALAHDLADTLPLWREAIAPVVQDVADKLLEGSDFATLRALAKPRATSKARPGRKSAPAASLAAVPAGVAAAPAAEVNLRQRRCAHCEGLSMSTYCSDRCAQDTATLAALAEQLADPARRTPEAWGALWPALARVPLPRMCRATKRSKPWASRVRAGKLVPASATWPALCRA